MKRNITAALLVLTFVVLPVLYIASCGGGGGGGSSTPPPSGVITTNNAVDVASAGAMAIMMPRNVGAAAVDLLIGELRNQPDTTFCTTGTYTFSPAPTVTAPSTTLSFADCKTADSGNTTLGNKITLNGSATITVTSLSDNFVTQPTYTIETTLKDIYITDTHNGTLSWSITGGMRISRVVTASKVNEICQSIDVPATKLTYSESGRMLALGPFIIHDVIDQSDQSGEYSFGTDTADKSTVDMDLGPLPLVVTPTTPLHGPGLNKFPVSGSFLVTAPSDSTNLTVTTTTDKGDVDIDVDTNGDGTVEGSVPTTWDVLD